jgi:hypothetical protein
MLGRTNTGGGGGGLNFRVIGGTTAPSNPKENDIWVNTDEKITSYTISATAPETPIPGMVWITPGASGDAFVVVTKKNPINVYPISAKQYVSSKWEDVVAKNYQDGEWVDWWSGELYEPGNMYEKYTGGWQQGETIGAGTTNVTDTGITLSTNSGARVHVETKQKVEFGDYKTLKATVEVTASNASSLVRLGYSSAPKTNLADATTKKELKPGNGFKGKLEITLPLDGAPDSAYVVVGAGVASTSFIVKKVQMLK